MEMLRLVLGGWVHVGVIDFVFTVFAFERHVAESGMFLVRHVDVVGLVRCLDCLSDLGVTLITFAGA